MLKNLILMFFFNIYILIIENNKRSINITNIFMKKILMFLYSIKE